MADQVEVPAGLIIDHYQRRVAELEMQVALLTARVALAENGHVEIEEASGTGLPVPSSGNDERPAPDKFSRKPNDGGSPSS